MTLVAFGLGEILKSGTAAGGHFVDVMASHGLDLNFLRDMRVTAPEPTKKHNTGAIRPTFFRGATWPEELPVEVKAVEAVKAVETSRPKTRKLRTRRQEQIPVYITHPHLPLFERLLLYTEALSPQQLAAEVGVVTNTIYRWKSAGTLPWRPAGRYVKHDQGPISEWAKQRQFTPIEQW